MAHARLLPCVASAIPAADLRRSAGGQRKKGIAGSSFLALSKFDSRNARGLANCTTTAPLAKREACNVVRCSSSSASVPQTERQRASVEAWDIGMGGERTIGGSCAEFKLSDFDLCSHVGVGLAGKGDEVLFEGVVRNPESPLKGMRVVLRQLESRRAQLWGQRALQVLSRLVPREDSHLSYATRVHGYIRAAGGSDQCATLTLVHGYNGSYSLHQWLHSEDWLSELETRLSLDEEAARRIGDDRTGGPAVSRQLRLVRILMRDLLIGVNYLHSRGYAHTQLRLQNLQVSEADKHVKVGLLGNAAAFPDAGRELEKGLMATTKSGDTRQLMIAYDMRCVGFIMAKMVLRELVDPSAFALFRNFLAQGNDPAGLREMFISLVNKGSPWDYPGIQLLDRDGGAGWNLLACLLAIKPTNRISCKDALRHPFLCGPMWRVAPTVDMTRWSVGSTIVRIVEEYIYGLQQQNRLSKLVDILERMNPNNTSEGWAKCVGGTWRLLHHTGRQIGLTTRAASPAVTIGGVTLSFTNSSSAGRKPQLSMTAQVKFTAMSPEKWPHDDDGDAVKGSITVRSPAVSLTDGHRLYTSDEAHDSSARGGSKTPQQQQEREKERRGQRWPPRQSLNPDPNPTSLPIVRMRTEEEELDMLMELDRSDAGGSAFPQRVLSEIRRQIPRELFDLSGLVCASYLDSRLMVLRGITGSACLFSRSPSVHASGSPN